MIRDERGITLAEVLMATAIIGIGLVGLLTVVPVSSYSVREGNSLTTATFLANQKMEEIKNAVWQQFPLIPPPGGNDCVGVSAGNGNVTPTSNNCTRTNPTVCNAGAACTIAADEVPVAGYTEYNRTVRIVDCSTVAGGCGGVVDPNFRRVTVTVTYHAITGTGTGTAGTTKPVVLTMNLSRR
jgi:type II secretory pathway pseudopilin PulG